MSKWKKRVKGYWKESKEEGRGKITTCLHIALGSVGYLLEKVVGKD